MAKKFRIYTNALTKEELNYVTEDLVQTRSVKNSYIIECQSGNEYKISYIVFNNELSKKMKENDSLILGIKNDKVVLTFDYLKGE